MGTYMARRALAAVLVIASLGVASCASGGAASNSDQTPATSALQQINPRDVSELKKGGDLRIPIDALPTNYNPLQVNGARVITWQMAEAVLPSAFRNGADGGHELNESFFSSVELTGTDPQVITYTINPEAKWSNGRSLSWEDLRDQAAALSAENPDFEGFSSVGYSNIRSVAMGRSGQEAVVTMAQPFAEWQGLFNMIIPSEISSDATTFNTGWLGKMTLTSGPFRIGEIDETEKTLTLARNEEFWGERPPLDRVIFRVLDPTARADELANDGIDLYPIGGDVDLYARAKTIDGVELRQAAERKAGQLTFNGAAGAPLQGKDVRVAVAQAIDPQAITDVVLGAIVPGAKAVGNHILPPTDKGYVDNSGALPFDPTKAAAQLDAAGWVDQGGKRTKDGKALTLRVVAPNTPVGTVVSQTLRAQLEAVGITADVATVPLDKFYNDYLLKGNFDIAAFEWTKSASPFAHDRPVFQKPEGDSYGSNFGRVYVPEIDDLYDRGLATLDEAET